jgi:hypothetical protein
VITAGALHVATLVGGWESIESTTDPLFYSAGLAWRKDAAAKQRQYPNENHQIL